MAAVVRIAELKVGKPNVAFDSCTKHILTIQVFSCFVHKDTFWVKSERTILKLRAILKLNRENSYKREEKKIVRDKASSFSISLSLSSSLNQDDLG